MHMELNKRIVAARDADSILAIVQAEHGTFNAVNAATACNRLAKTRKASSKGLRTDDPRVHALLSTVTRVSATLRGREVSNTLWALATLGWQAGEGAMRSALEGAAVRVAPSMNAQDVANTVWALATLGWQATAELGVVFESLIGSLVHDCGWMQLPSSHLSQLLQAHLASQFLGLGLVTLPSSVLQVALNAYTQEARKVTVSNGQREVGESLRRLGVSHELEYITADGLFSIDLAIVDRRIALEFDGPSHFTTNTLEPLGHTRLRDRLLSAMGWHVVSIPFFEWDGLHQTDERDAYVERRVHGALG
jgi:hypothetical protein